jgi:hypothetical protein
LARLVEPLQTSLTAALSGQPFMADLNRARTAIEDYRAEDHSGVTSVIRRPLHRMVEDLEQVTHSVPGSSIQLPAG